MLVGEACMVLRDTSSDRDSLRHTNEMGGRGVEPKSPKRSHLIRKRIGERKITQEVKRASMEEDTQAADVVRV